MHQTTLTLIGNLQKREEEMAQLFPEKCSQKFCFNQGNVWQSQLEERISITDSKEEKKSGVLSAYSSLGAAPSPGSFPDEAKAANTEHSSSTLAQIDHDRCSSLKKRKGLLDGGWWQLRKAVRMDQVQGEKKSQRAGVEDAQGTGEKGLPENKEKTNFFSTHTHIHICKYMYIYI